MLPCYFHRNNQITKFCSNKQCTLPLCWQCQKLHQKDHHQHRTTPLIVPINQAFQTATFNVQKYKQRAINIQAEIKTLKNDIITIIQEYFQQKSRNIQEMFIRDNWNGVNQSQLQNKLQNGSLKALILYYSNRQYYNSLSNFQNSKIVNRAIQEQLLQIIKHDKIITRSNIQDIKSITKVVRQSTVSTLNQKFRKNQTFQHDKESHNISDLSIVDQAKNSMCLFGQSFLNKGNVSITGNNTGCQEIGQNMSSNITFKDRKLSLDCIKRPHTRHNHDTRDKDSRRRLLYEKVTTQNMQMNDQIKHQSLERESYNNHQVFALNTNYSQKHLVKSKYYVANALKQNDQQKLDYTENKPVQQINKSLQKYQNSPQSIVTHNKLISRNVLSKSKNRLMPSQQNKLLQKFNRPLLLKNNPSLGNILKNKLTITNKSTFENKSLEKCEQSPKQSQFQQQKFQKKSDFQGNIQKHFKKYSVLENYEHFDEPLSFAREKQRTQRSVTVAFQQDQKNNQQRNQKYKNTFRKIDSISNKISNAFASKTDNRQKINSALQNKAKIQSGKQTTRAIINEIRNDSPFAQIDQSQIKHEILYNQVCRNFQDIKRQHEQNQREIRRRQKITIDDLVSNQEKISQQRLHLKNNESKSVPHLGTRANRTVQSTRYPTNLFSKGVSNTIDTYQFEYKYGYQILSPKQVKKLIEEKSKSKYSGKQSPDRQILVGGPRGQAIRQFQVSPVQMHGKKNEVLKQNDMNRNKIQKTPVKDLNLQEKFVYNPKGSIIDQIYSNQKSQQRE